MGGLETKDYRGNLFWLWGRITSFIFEEVSIDN